MGYGILCVANDFSTRSANGSKTDAAALRGFSFAFVSTVLDLKTSYMAGYVVIGATAVSTVGLLSL